jgi:hypothetical protein
MLASLRKKERKVFFSEEKKQKTFVSWQAGNEFYTSQGGL